VTARGVVEAVLVRVLSTRAGRLAWRVLIEWVLR